MTFRNELFYITPIENIASILVHGLLSNEATAGIQHRSVAMEVVQERRDGVKVPNGLKLHQYVNLYFDARNPMMFKRKEQVDKFCVLSIKPEVLNIPGVVIADRNASSDYVYFMPSPGGLEEVDFDLVYCEDWRDPDLHRYFIKKSTKCAEVLVPHALLPEYITGAYVVSDAASALLRAQGFSLTIMLNPRMFFRE